MSKSLSKGSKKSSPAKSTTKKVVATTSGSSNKKSVPKKGIASARTRLTAVAVKNVRPKIMVASTVYHNRDVLLQLCGILNGYGYDVINSEYGTLHPPLGMNNIEACLAAVGECDVFFGIITPFYSTGITHQEFNEAIRLGKPRRFVAHSFVTFTRTILKSKMFTRGGVCKKFKLKSTNVLDDLRVIDMYNAAIEHHLPYAERKYHWVQEFFRSEELFRHVETLFKDIGRVKRELIALNPAI